MMICGVLLVGLMGCVGQIDTIVNEQLADTVQISIDDHGVPTIVGSSMLDVVRGEGFMHARDRYVQMDMMRRYAAGEMAELAGANFLALDQSNRRFRGRAVCEEIFTSLSPREQAVLEAYADGVNMGLDSMESFPREYGVFGSDPRRWTPADSLLVNLSMTMTLTDSSEAELDRHEARRILPSEWIEFLLTPVDPRDKPMIPDVGGPAQLPPMPRAFPSDMKPDDPGEAPARQGVPGSNNWAVAGSRTAAGGALLASDPHLMITLPGIWYRVQLLWSAGDQTAELTGLSIPGLPGVTIGTNGRVAWGFTNATIDRMDFILLEIDPDDPSRYKVPDGWESFEEFEEEIKVMGGEPETLNSRWTRWGPVVDSDADGSLIAVAWPALRPECVNINVIEMAHVSNVDDAVEVMRGWYGPPQNVLLADSDGRIAYVLSGWLPARRGFDGRFPVSWADGNAGWDGPLDESLRPVVVDPTDGVLYTANNRIAELEQSRLLGHEWGSPDRAARIDELLGDRVDLDEADMLAMQLDTAAPGLELYRDLVLESVSEAHPDEQVRRARQLVVEWNGTSDADQIGIGILNRYRRAVNRNLKSYMVDAGDGASAMSLRVSEAPIRMVLEQQPKHLVPASHGDWSRVNREVFERVVAAMTAEEGGLETPWGERNQSFIAHPFAAVFPEWLRGNLVIEKPQSGYWGSVRVAGSRFGASARMVIDPARPREAILQTPGGQSGSWESPNWMDFHDDWQGGQPTPMMPGESSVRFELVPKPITTP